MRRRTVLPLLAGALALTAAGCATVGPRSIRSARFDYNRAIVETRSEQMLTNLVRLRYRDPLYFLEISSVSTQYILGAGGEASIGSIGQAETGGVGGLVAYEERPTIVYLPLQGEQYVRQLLAPVPMESIVLLTSTGWRMDRIFRCCVQRVNELWNAPTASGPTPDRAPTYAAFLEMAGLFEELRQAGVLEVRFRRVAEGETPPTEPLGEGDDRFVLSLGFRADTGSREQARLERLQELLGLDPKLREFYLAKNPTVRQPYEIAVLPRSILGAMSYLAQAVEPPPEDVEAGLVTVTRHPDGSVFDWSDLLGGLIRVRSSATPPEGAFVRVLYRGTWFFVADDDLSSKTTFDLLDLLFQLQAGQSTGGGPTLTLPLN